MGARRKGRAAFDFHGRAFVWWVENDKYLRIASADKTFIIAYAIGRDPSDPPTIEVIGQSFPGIDRSERRPLWLVVAEPTGSMGAGCTNCSRRHLSRDGSGSGQLVLRDTCKTSPFII